MFKNPQKKQEEVIVPPYQSQFKKKIHDSKPAPISQSLGILPKD